MSNVRLINVVVLLFALSGVMIGQELPTRVGTLTLVPQYLINATASVGGWISPAGAVFVDSGANQTFAWNPYPGYVVDSISVDGIRVPETDVFYTFFEVGADHSIRINFKYPTSLQYRTFTAADLAISTPTKKKPVAYHFSFQLVNTYPPEAVAGLRINFGGSGSPVIEIESSAPFGSATTADGREWNFTGATVAPGEAVLISGISLRRPAEVISWNWDYPGSIGGNHGRFKIEGQRAVYPMPNAANVREELVPRSFGWEGLTVGIPRNDSARYYGWVRIKRSSQLQRSLVFKDRVHAGVARCFEFVREKRMLPPSAEDNVMFANLAALKINIKASYLGVTPVGLPYLVFQDTVANPLDGMSVAHIAEYADSILSGYYVGTTHVCESAILFDQVGGAIERINAAFAGPMDTVAYASGISLTGVKGVEEVPFLLENPDIVPEAMQWDRGRPAVPAPSELTLIGNYPNPFNPTTTIRFSLPTDAFVSAVVYNQLGQQVAVLENNEFLTEGGQEIDFDGSALGSGLYFCRISMIPAIDPDEGTGKEPETETAVVRMLLVK